MKVSIRKVAKKHSKFNPKAQGDGKTKRSAPKMPMGKMTWGG